MKKFKAAMPTVIYTVLLLSIALLSFLIVGKTEAKTTSSAGGSALTENKPSEQTNNNDPETSETQKAIYDDEFPRKGADGSQKIYGEGDVLLQTVLQTSIGNYVIVSSTCEKGDVPNQNPCTAIVKTNENGDLSEKLVFSENEGFVTAQTTVLGITTVASDTNKPIFIVRIINYALSEITAEYKISACEEIRIIPTGDSFLLFASYVDECLVYALSDDKLIFQSIDKSSLVNFFEYEDHYLLFCNLPEGGFCSFKLGKDALNVTDKKTYSTASLICVFPSFESGNSSFITVENLSGKNYARKYPTGSDTPITEKILGNMSITECIETKNGVILLCDGAASGYILLTANLKSAFYESNGQEEKTILATLYTNDLFLCLVADKDNNVSFSGEEPFDKGTKAVLLSCPSGKILMYLEKQTEYGEKYVSVSVINKK